MICHYLTLFLLTKEQMKELSEWFQLSKLTNAIISQSVLTTTIKIALLMQKMFNTERIFEHFIGYSLKMQNKYE